MQPLSQGGPEPAELLPDESPSDQEFQARWREELLQRAWEALAKIEQQTAQPFYTVLRFRAEHPETKSARMAEVLAGRLDRPVSAVRMRQTLHRAREKFGSLLPDEVARSLQTMDPVRIEEELSELGLLLYCRLPSQRRDPG
jgi:RNA polymerase sigma-70 factor (ECF subfamily)